MSRLPDLSALAPTPVIVRRLERASINIGRLDARISASSAEPTWRQRTAWIGRAKALTAQGVEIDEIDIFGHACGVPLPARAPLLASVRDALLTTQAWPGRRGDGGDRHWREDLPFTFDAPPDWTDRPLLLRAVELLARWVTTDPGVEPWLGFPELLRRLRVTSTALPCLIPADPALRRSPGDAEAIVRRYLRAMADLAEAGLERLDAIEAERRRAAHALATAYRAAGLAPLVALLARQPAVTPKSVAATLRLTISGAGRLLSRAAGHGLLVEVSGRQAWRIYVTPDLAHTYGFTTRPRGRPPSPPSHDEVSLDRLFAEFDAAVATFDATVGPPPEPLVDDR